MASGPITSWQIDGEILKTVRNFNFGAPKSLQMVTAAMKLKDACSLEEKSMTNLDSILKSRNITLPTKVHLVKTMFFSSGHVWMWELDHKESWALKNWCFELWCWRRHLRVPWTARRSNLSILKEISPEYSLEGLMLMMKLHLLKMKRHLMRRTDSLEKTVMLGKIEGRRRKRKQRMRRLDGITNSMDMSLRKLQERAKNRVARRAVVHGGHKESDTT